MIARLGKFGLETISEAGTVLTKPARRTVRAIRYRARWCSGHAAIARPRAAGRPRGCVSRATPRGRRLRRGAGRGMLEMDEVVGIDVWAAPEVVGGARQQAGMSGALADGSRG